MTYQFAREVNVSGDIGLRQYLGAVYNYMGLGLLLSTLTAFLALGMGGVFYSLNEAGKIVGFSVLGWIAVFSPLAMIFFFGKLERARWMYWLFTGVMGVSLGILFAKYSFGSIVGALFTTAIVFFGCALVGHVTKRNLSGMGQFLFMALLGLIVASIVGIFIQSSFLAFVINVAGVVIFAGLTAYDSQRLKEEYLAGYASQHTAILGALSMYLNFINLFQFILSLTGSSSDD